MFALTKKSDERKKQLTFCLQFRIARKCNFVLQSRNVESAFLHFTSYIKNSCPAKKDKIAFYIKHNPLRMYFSITYIVNMYPSRNIYIDYWKIWIPEKGMVVLFYMVLNVVKFFSMLLENRRKMILNRNVKLMFFMVLLDL